ncbi:MAG: hypothetical protein EB086_14510 [Rhodobacteraceae bacterium]|nr:hypothetical protein [Paracoccaceae bacterium]
MSHLVSVSFICLFSGRAVVSTGLSRVFTDPDCSLLHSPRFAVLAHTTFVDINQGGMPKHLKNRLLRRGLSLIACVFL